MGGCTPSATHNAATTKYRPSASPVLVRLMGGRSGLTDMMQCHMIPTGQIGPSWLQHSSLCPHCLKEFLKRVGSETQIGKSSG